MENYIDKITELLGMELNNLDADHESLADLLEKYQRTFRDEHLPRFDEGKPMPPDVQELRRYMKDWLEMHPNNGYIEEIWNGKEWNELDQVAYQLKLWIKMIDSYYPAPTVTKKPRETTETIIFVPQQTEECREEYDWFQPIAEECRAAEEFRSQVEEPQGKKSNGKPGRPIKDNFSDVIVHQDKEKTLEKLHKVANGKNGKDFALVMQAAMELGWINKPSFNQVGKEFGNIGGSSVFYGYIGTPSKFLQEDLNRVKNRLQNEL